jgi:hypothetical protein
MLDWAFRHHFQAVQSSVLGVATNYTPWPHYLSLIEMIRGYVTWRKKRSDAKVGLTIHTQDDLLLALLRAGRLDLSELVACPEETRFWVQIHRSVSDVMSFLEHAPNNQTLSDVLDKYCLPDREWDVKIIPNPWGSRRQPRSSEILNSRSDLDQWSVARAGLFPGSTLRIILHAN